MIYFAEQHNKPSGVGGTIGYLPEDGFYHATVSIDIFAAGVVFAELVCYF